MGEGEWRSACEDGRVNQPWRVVTAEAGRAAEDDRSVLHADPTPPPTLSLDRNRIGEDGETERKRRWFGDSEFIYSMDAARGHLPLTSALRGTSLIKEIFAHPLWEEEEFNKKDKADKKERKF